MSPYTVLLLYPDYLNDNGDETYLAHVEAADPREAVTAARQQATDANAGEHGCSLNDPTDMALLIVFPGHHTPALTVYDDLSPPNPEPESTPMEQPTDYVLASLNPPSVWQFYPTLEAAAAKADIVNEYTQRLDARLGTPARHFYLSDPLQEISLEKFTEMFEVLPPEHVRTSNGVFSFLMLEHFSGPFTSQYASYGSNHYTRLVDATDESTWITPEEIKRFHSAKECGPGEHPPGTEIYYTGDVANQSGFGVITALNRDPQWGDSYDFTLEDGREIKGIATHSLGDKYEGHGGTRFVTRAAYDEYRQKMMERYAGQEQGRRV